MADATSSLSSSAGSPAVGASVASGGAPFTPFPHHWRADYGLLLLRVGLSALVLLLLSIEGASGPLRLGGWWLLLVVVGSGLVNFLFYLLIRWDLARRRPSEGDAPPPNRALLTAQLVLDILAVSVLVYLTGGVRSVFIFLPFACVLAAAVVLGGYTPLLYASGATVLLAGVSLAYSLADLGLFRLPLVSREWLGSVRPPGSDLARDLAAVVGEGVALHLVAFLGAGLADRLRRETHLKEEILAAIAEGLIVADAHHRVVYVNNEAVRLLGFSTPGQFIGRRWEEIFRRRGDRQVRGMLTQPGPGPRSCVIEFDHRERGKRYLSVKTSPFRRSNGALDGVVAIVRDITAQRVMEAVQERAERLEEISLVAAGIAHELRNPLASIRGCVQELARLETSCPQSERLARIVVAEADRLDAIVGEFLHFARMRPPRPVPCDLHTLIEEVVVLLQAQAADSLRRIEIRTSLPADLVVTADREQLKQVLLNLTRNAVEAMERKGGQGRLTISAEVVSSMPGRDGPTPAVRIEVADTGCGIPPEHIDKLFTPFFTTRPTGTGMGLSIVERIVRAHGGHIEVESQQGRGSVFRLWLPLNPTRGASSGSPVTSSRPPADTDGRGALVLPGALPGQE